MSAPAARPGLSALSAMPRAAFVAALDGIYEHSPWVADAAWTARPFASLAALETALAHAVAAAPPSAQLALVRAHPELAGRAAAAGDVAPLSAQEQGRAGLDRCSPDELARLRELNAAYAERFGFPFVIAVHGLTPAAIIAAMRSRLEHGRAQELAEALRQIDRIAGLRLRDRFRDAPGGAA